MKKLFFLFAVFGLMLFSGCGNAPKDKASHDDEATEESADAVKPDEKIKDCDDFLDKYEAWMDEYLELLDDYMKNPMDAELASKFMELGTEAAGWSTQWAALYDCADSEEYEERFEEIEKKAEKKLEELGLG